MPIALTKTDETREAALSHGWIDDCQIATWRDKSMLRIVGVWNGCPMDVYVAHESGCVDKSIADAELPDADLVPTRLVDADLAFAEGVEHAEGIAFRVYESRRTPKVGLTAPGVGWLEHGVEPGQTLERVLARERRYRRQDSEGRRMGALGAMAIALATDDEDDLARIVDTVFTGGDVDYRGVRSWMSSDGRLVVEVVHKEVAFRSDGIEIPNLPETTRIAIKGRERRKLGQVVEVAGFEDLDITGISAQAMNMRITPSRNWMRLDVRDEDGARLKELDRDEAMAAALATFRRRAGR